MKKNITLLSFVIFAVVRSWALPADSYHLLIAPGTLSENSATLLWDKQPGKDGMYEISLNGKVQGTTRRTNFVFANLAPGTWYTVSLRIKQGNSSGKEPTATLKFRTAAKGKLYNILDFGAKADSNTKNTHAIQAAIDACTEGGTVYVPRGIFLSGALFLKSNMTLYIEKGGVLKGAVAPEDYLPMIRNRFEGWELNTYASLLNAGTLNRNGAYNVKNLRIAGGGTILGGGKPLGDAMIKNPEGYVIAKPTRNVRISDCDFKRGHGISIGSEMSGGVSDVLVQDCRAGALLHGFQIKGTKERGGYVKNITVEDCELMQITIFSKLNYNNDGEAAPEPPSFEHFVFRNIDLSKASSTEPVIDINGFNDPRHRLKNVDFANIMLPQHAKIVINDAQQVRFTGLKSGNGGTPEYVVNNSTGISSEGKAVK